MKKLGILVALLLLVSPVVALDVQRSPLAVSFDLDGEAADNDQIVAGPDALADSTTYTIDAQPDICRLVDITVVDADSSITAGTLTVTGKDCWQEDLVATFTFAGGGSGVKTLSVAQGTYQSLTARFSGVTSVVTGALTGEGAGDTLIVGYTANSDYIYPILGVREDRDGRRVVNPFATYKGADDVTVNGTAVASYNTVDGGAFQNVAVGDVVYLTYGGVTYERQITARADDDNATINAMLPAGAAISTTAKVGLRFKRLYILAEADDAWIPMQSRRAATFNLDVDANANTGGVVSTVECSMLDSPRFSYVQVDSDTVASGSTGTASTSIDLDLSPFSYCRMGIKFGTGDDADVAVENIQMQVAVTK